MNRPWKNKKIQGVGLGIAALGGLWLSGLAVRNFLSMGHRAKASEGIWNLERIRASELAYRQEYGVYVAADLQPQPESERYMKPFEVAEGSGWLALGWPPEGEDFFRCQYQVSLVGEDFRALARCDMNHDGDYAVFEATETEPARRTTPTVEY